MKIQLLYFDGCPNVDAARAAVGQALANTGIEARVEELDVNAGTTPEALRGWGSPTILVNGKDVGGEREATGCSCRLYRNDAGDACGAPDVARISALLLDVATPMGGESRECRWGAMVQRWRSWRRC